MTIDGEAFEGGTAKDYLLELGAGRVLPELEAAVVGQDPGDEETATVNFPDDYHGEDVAGKQAEFAVTVREVREKELPELNDDFAAEASEFDTLAELREDMAAKIADMLEEQTAERFRESALDAAVANAKVEIPDEVVKARANEMWDRVERRLRQQGMDPAAYLQMQGKTRDEIIAEATPDASRALKREAVLAAVADAEQIEVSEEDMLDALQVPPGHEDHGHPEPAEALAELRESGRDGMLRDDLRMRRRPGVHQREREADSPRAGRGPRGDLDAREGARGEGRALEAGGPGALAPGLRLRRRGRSAAPGR